ncbi:MAG: hypothetical protein RLZZ457_124, partial [Pseudomonadota bacterium]
RGSVVAGQWRGASDSFIARAGADHPQHLRRTLEFGPPIHARVVHEHFRIVSVLQRLAVSGGRTEIGLTAPIACLRTVRQQQVLTALAARRDGVR